MASPLLPLKINALKAFEGDKLRMIDFNRKPSPKSTEEIEFDELNKQYEAKFGEPYFFQIGIDSGSWKETLNDIRQRINNDDKKKETNYEQGCEY